MHWSTGYIGLRYDAAAGLDCGGLAERVQREVFGRDVRLPSERRPRGPFERSALVRELLADFGQRTDAPADGDAVLLIARGRLQHVGVYCRIGTESWVLHVPEGAHSVLQRLRDLAGAGYQVEGYYQWK